MSRLDTVGLAKQASGFGTKTTVMEYFLPVETADPDMNQDEMTVEETTGSKFPTDVEYGLRFFEVGFAGAWRVASLPRILSGFMGAPTTTTPGGGTTSRLHTFNPLGKTLVPHSVLVNRTDPSPAITDLFWDAVGNELTLSAAVNEFGRFEAAYVAKELDDAQAEPTPTLDLGRRSPFHAITAFISVNGAAEVALPISDFSLTYSNNVDTDQGVLGQRTLWKVQEGNVDGTLDFTCKDTLSAHYRRALLAAPDNVKVRLVATGPILEGAIAQKVEIIAYRGQYTAAPAGIDAGDTLDDVAVSMRLALDTTANKFVEVLVTNAVATY